MTDTSSKPSPPVCVLCASSLLMVITVHAKDVIYWDIVSGEVIKRVTDFSASEIMSACLDDRERKLIAGFSDGNITVFNCLNGSKLRTYGPLLHAVRFLIYTPDKTIICVAGVGDILIFDDLVEDDEIPDACLREFRGHDADVVSICYSYDMALIATSDLKGTVIVWDYQFLSIEIIIKDFRGVDIG
jgi:WD40 repeat protein